MAEGPSASAVMWGIVVGLALPIAFIVVGAINKDNCRIEPMIPVMMIVLGAVFGLQGLLDILRRFTGIDLGKPLICLHGLLGIASLAVLIAASVYVYPQHKKYSPTSISPSYCDDTTYKLAFWGITVIWVSLLIFTCCCGGVYYRKKQ